MKADDYVDIGRYLRDVRESLNATVEQAARALHIQAKYLDKLEAGNLQDMPPRAYVRGYIKNYAEFLRLDSGEVLKAYEKLFDGNGQEFFIPENNTQQGLPSSNILWFCFAGIVGLYAYWYFAVDHTAASNITIESPPQPENGAAASTIEGEWKNCLSVDSLNCFVELQLKSETAEIKLPGTVEKIDVETIKPEDPKPEDPQSETSKPEAATHETIKQETTKPEADQSEDMKSDDSDSSDSDDTDENGNN